LASDINIISNNFQNTKRLPIRSGHRSRYNDRAHTLPGRRAKVDVFPPFFTKLLASRKQSRVSRMSYHNTRQRKARRN